MPEKEKPSQPEEVTQESNRSFARLEFGGFIKSKEVPTPQEDEQKKPQDGEIPNEQGIRAINRAVLQGYISFGGTGKDDSNQF